MFRLVSLLNYLAWFHHTLADWKTDDTSARLLAGALENDRSEPWPALHRSMKPAEFPRVPSDQLSARHG